MAERLLFAPIGVETFLREFYEQRPFVRTGDPDRFTGVFSLDDVELAIAAAPVEVGDGRRGAFGIRAADDGTSDQYAFEGQGSKGRSNTAPHRAFDEGFTIVADALISHNEVLARLCTDLGRLLQHPIGANLYLTPAGAQGFAVHADTHDTFLCQIEGRKTWQVWRPDEELPLPERKLLLTAPVREPDLEVDLRPGDLLYLPRGWWHAGVAHASDHSLHITLGSLTIKWVDLIGQALRSLAESDVRYRTSVTIPDTQVELDAAEDTIWERAVSLLHDLAQEAASDPRRGREIVNTVLAQRVRAYPPSFERRLHQTIRRDRVSLTSELEVRVSPRPIVHDEPDGRVTIAFVGGHVTGPAVAREALWFAAHAQRFRAVDLPGLSPELQLELAQELLLQGLVRAVEPA